MTSQIFMVGEYEGQKTQGIAAAPGNHLTVFLLIVLLNLYFVRSPTELSGTAVFRKFLYVDKRVTSVL